MIPGRPSGKSSPAQLCNSPVAVPALIFQPAAFWQHGGQHWLLTVLPWLGDEEMGALQQVGGAAPLLAAWL